MIPIARVVSALIIRGLTLSGTGIGNYHLLASVVPLIINGFFGLVCLRNTFDGSF